MKVELFLDEEDYLTYQLYTASISDRIKKKRKTAWILISLVFLAIAGLSYLTDRNFLFVYSLILGVSTLIFYPLFSRRRYKNHYRGYIRENYQGMIGKPTEMEFREDYIAGQNEAGESKINVSEVEGIIELPSHFFIKLKSGPSILINKLRLNDLEGMRNYLQQLSERLSVEFSQELDWKWK